MEMEDVDGVAQPAAGAVAGATAIVDGNGNMTAYVCLQKRKKKKKKELRKI